MQCDFDTIGTLALEADVETALVIHDLFRALGIRDFTLRVNNRLVLAGLLERLDLADSATDILRSLDKLDKIGRQKVAAEMVATGLSEKQAASVLELAEIEGTNDDTLGALGRLVAGNEKGESGVARLADLLAAVLAGGVEPQRIRITPSIARGLDYYTGTVFETFLDSLPAIGSVCSGGRYDNKPCPASAPRWGSTGCWQRWKNWARSKRCERRPRYFWPISTPRICTTICGWPRRYEPPAWAWNSIPSRKSWERSSNTPTAAAFGWPSWPAPTSGLPAPARSRISPAAKARLSRWPRYRERSPINFDPIGNARESSVSRSRICVPDPIWSNNGHGTRTLEGVPSLL